MKLILPIFTSFMLLTALSSYAENCMVGNANDPNHCCSRADHSCTEGNCRLTPCASEQVSTQQKQGRAALTSEFRGKVKGSDRATPVGKDATERE